MSSSEFPKVGGGGYVPPQTVNPLERPGTPASFQDVDPLTKLPNKEAAGRGDLPSLPPPLPNALKGFSAADLIFIQSALGVSALKANADASKEVTSRTLDLRKNKTLEQLAKIQEAVSKQIESAKSSESSSAWNWAMTGLSLVAGAVLCAIPGGQVLGVPLLVGAVTGIIMNLWGEQIIDLVASGLEKLGMSEENAKILASVLVVALVIAVSFYGGPAAASRAIPIAGKLLGRLGPVLARGGEKVAEMLPKLGNLLKAAEGSSKAQRISQAASAATKLPENYYNVKAGVQSKDASDTMAESVELKAQADLLQSVIDSSIDNIETMLRTMNETVSTSLKSMQTALQPRYISA